MVNGGEANTKAAVDFLAQFLDFSTRKKRKAAIKFMSDLILKIITAEKAYMDSLLYSSTCSLESYEMAEYRIYKLDDAISALDDVYDRQVAMD